MKFLTTALAFAMLYFSMASASAASGRQLLYTCAAGRSVSVVVIASGDGLRHHIVGRWNSRGFDFAAPSKLQNGARIFFDRATNYTFEVQEPRPGTTVNDPLWATLSDGTRSQDMTCYLSK